MDLLFIFKPADLLIRLILVRSLGVAIDLRSGTFGICKQEQQDPKALSEVTDEK
jgi:hypothetical protein